LVKILCDYGDESDTAIEKIKHDSRQDKIAIFTEVIDVMKAIYELSK
jgi:hypothetical protein